MKLPFLWGSATSSHQVEGQNVYNDWWEWEQAGKLKEPSGEACDQYRRFADDIRLIADLGHNAHRFSIEWSRLEPEEGRWNEEAFEHYRQVFEALRAKNIEPVVTLHHFTNPVWFMKQGGWLNPKSTEYFGRYVERVVRAYGRYARIWVTINEPLIYIYHGYLAGLWPPGITSFSESIKVFRSFIYAHIEAYRRIHEISKTEFGVRPWVSIAHHVTYFQPCKAGSLLDRLSVYCRNWFFNDLFIDGLKHGFLFFPGIACERLPARGTLDYVGINYYTRNFIHHVGLSGEKLIGDICDDGHHADQIKEKNAMGWPICAEGLYRVLRRAKKYRLPIVVCENGICAHDDEQRVRFMRDHLAMTRRAMAEGVPVKGFFYWSLLDNFEWAHGFGPRFGMVEVDYRTQERKIRRSAHEFTEICRKIEQDEQQHAT